MLASAAFAQTKALWTEQIPLFPVEGEKLKYRVRLSAAVNRVSFVAFGSTSEIPLTSVGDRLWEIEMTAPRFDPRDVYNKFMGFIRVFDGQTTFTVVNVGLHGHSNDLPAVRITKLAEDLQRSDYILNVHSSGFFNTLYNAAQAFGVNPEAVLKRVYQSIGDDYDFVNFMIANQAAVENRYHFSTRNNTFGIGMSQFDNSANYGSKGKLIGVSIFPNPHFIDGASEGVAHEFGHQWVEFVSGLPVDGRPHWPLSTMATGVMGWSDPINRQGLNFPCQFVANANGGYSVSLSGGAKKFNDFDLYLMGLIEAADVSPQVIVTDAQKIQAGQSSSCTGVGTLTANQFVPFTVQQLIQLAGGPRSPSAASSQKNFRVLNVVVSRDGLLSSAEMSYYESLVRRIEAKGQIPNSEGAAAGFTSPFGVLTGGRAQITAKISSAVIPEISYGGIANAGSYSDQALTPGTVASLFGSNLAPSTASASSVPLPTTLAGIRVLVEGKPVPLFFVSSGQINFQIPYGLKTVASQAGDGTYLTSVRVERDGISSNASFISLRVHGPGIITYSDNQAVAQDSQGKLIGPVSPAKPGDTITVYFVGSSQLSEPLSAGDAAPLDRLIRVTGTNNVQLNGVTFQTDFVGLTPGGVGLLQANVRLPAVMTNGEYKLTLLLAGTRSNEVKLSVAR